MLYAKNRNDLPLRRSTTKDTAHQQINKIRSSNQKFLSYEAHIIIIYLLLNHFLSFCTNHYSKRSGN
jgi:hypothetical protein